MPRIQMANEGSVWQCDDCGQMYMVLVDAEGYGLRLHRMSKRNAKRVMRWCLENPDACEVRSSSEVNQ